jgi:hypothetical protein
MIEEKPEKFVKHVFPLSKSGGPFFTRPKRTSELDHSSALRPASKMVNDPCLGGGRCIVVGTKRHCDGQRSAWPEPCGTLAQTFLMVGAVRDGGP